MINQEDIESYLIRSELDFEEIGDGVWMIEAGSGEEAPPGPPLVVSYLPPVLLLRSAVRDVPEDEDDRVQLFRRLLELNATDLVHGSYGLEDGEVVLSDTLELENLDFTEFQASLESLSLALTSHREELTKD